MGKVVTVLTGVAAIVVLAGAYAYWSIGQGHKEDIQACKVVDVNDAVSAVVKDVTRPSNKIFSNLGITAKDINVDVNRVKVDYSTVLVPFKLEQEPRKQYFAMPRCSRLSDIEYSSN